MDYLLIHKIIVVLSDFFSILLGIWVLSGNKKSGLNRMFFFLMILNMAWITVSYFAVAAYASEKQLSLFFSRLGYGIGVWAIIPSYFISLHLIKEEKKRPFLNGLIWVTTLFSSIAATFSPWMVKSVNVSVAGSFPAVLGWFRFIFFGILIFWFLFIFVRLFLGYSKLLSEEERRKVRYLISGLVVFLLANLIFNIFLPIYKGIAQYYYIGNYSSLILGVFASFAIIRQELFGIKVILTEILVGTMGVVLLVVPFLVDIIWLKAVLFAIFTLFCVIGYLLINSSLREARGKEILEDMVREQTKELAEKVKELDKWYHLTVGRELRMAELKERIRKLEEKSK